ncbi:ABC transporter [Desulfobacter hydrogenophilus]|uniref:ABC transporter n=1 Tax=Desulfobacter hydrogenophilus TaxID=2291 RepID=A0A328FGR9_9BACT|nr:AarF/UbiB family protein [Desulfobacter hydrogenophilus]NDY70619.1 AarF/ABC1/UbiB kinase family protein [Desulfobacter hydrogenophilus]QBH13988.1 AarF/ABC1/UbiB kinase family protein [Desulfobacter hydrogenophilus]RAM03599.1 ABC transporter [Desulfobacter hydrogenophilus]
MQINDLRKLGRFKDIVAILAKYGFDDIVLRLDVPGSDLLRKMHPVETGKSGYERFRAAIEDLGPTCIKFGQIMSLRPDLLPQEVLAELEKLQDDVPAAEYPDIESVVRENLGVPIRDVFSRFDREPIAAASLSQVHQAVLRREKTFVAVKVQRPDIEKTIKLDLDILEGIAGFLDQQFEDLQVYDLPELVRVTRRNMIKELDFTQERNNMEIARSYVSEESYIIPVTYEQYSNDKVLVMELIRGKNFKGLCSASGWDRERIALKGLKVLVKQILDDGFFHADPHPGNLLITEDMNLCVIDWGLVGRLTEKDRFQLISLLKAFVEKDSEALVHIFLRICHTGGRNVDAGRIERELMEILDNYHAVPIKDINVGQFLMSMTALMRAHHLGMPSNLSLMVKALVTAEGSARLVYPELDIVSEISDYVHGLVKKRYRPEVIWRSVRNSLASLWYSQRQIPEQLGRVVGRLEQGRLGFRFRLEKLEQLVDSLESASNRLTAGIITGAIIMGSSMIITTGVGPFLFGFPALGVIGYIVSVVLGLWLIYTILKTRPH